MVIPYRILAENPLGKEPLETQIWEISITTDLGGISCVGEKWMELGRLDPLPLDLQALLPYHRVEYANTEFFFSP
jgi:hypothetical protein